MPLRAELYALLGGLLGLALGCAGVGRAPELAAGGSLSAHPEPELVVARHQVTSGQTLYGIARANGVTVRELAAANGLSEARPLTVGEELIIPSGGDPVDEGAPPSGPETQSPRRGSTAPSQEPTHSPEARGERRASSAARAVEVGHGEGTLQWPLRGVLYARFGRKGKEPHDGIDLAAPAGTPVKTAAPGSVLFAGEQKGYGLLAIVDHGEGLVTLYAHNRDLRVTTGQKVHEGQVIATVGESGKTSGPHLHFEVRKQGVPVDPVASLGPLPRT